MTVVLELVGAQVIGSVKAVRQERRLGEELWPALHSKQSIREKIVDHKA